MKSSIDKAKNSVVLGNKCAQIIAIAEACEIKIDDGNVVDLCVDQLCVRFNLQPSLDDIRSALVIAGLGYRFPQATAKR